MDKFFAPHAVFSLTQALHLVGIVPCAFIVIFLLSLARHNRQVLIPAVYFISLACAFASPLLPTFFPGSSSAAVSVSLLVGESVLVAMSFLMILQFLTGRIPPLPYWLVLAIPLVGGGTLIWASLMQDGCAVDHSCADIGAIRTLYNVFGSSLVFLWLMASARRLGSLADDDPGRRHKYALVVSLVGVHLMVLAVSLAKLAGHLALPQAELIETLLRLTFIYLVITSLFRVFYPSLVTQMVPVPMAKPYNPELDVKHVEAIKTLLEENKVYREMRLNRAALAKKIGIGEYHLSRIINHHFGKNLSELLNGYRIEEAKARLKGEQTPITTIAFEVGFNSIASFNRVFKQKVGVSPTEFRAA